VVSESEWNAQKDRWLPTEVDKTHVRGLMHPVLEPGKIAGWIAPPSTGINDKPVDYEYVHFH
jgi:benzoyl-CoA 2,3-dioxygenase component B